MSINLPDLFAKKFIARPDVKALQYGDGIWSPHTTTGKHDGERIPWRREHLEAHLAGTTTFGHYLLSADSRCKLFAFDIDLAKAGVLPTLPVEAADDELAWKESFVEVPDLRAAWLNRAHPARSFMKLQFKEVAHQLLATIRKELDLPCAVAYSGNKGLHVYAFTGLIPADEAREGAQIVLDSLGTYKAFRGEHFFKHVNEDPVEGYPNLSIEVFPKQNSLDGKDLGNLMRLPLGKNLKAPNEPTFFVDMKAPLGVLAPADPIWSLTTEDPWND